MRQVPFGILIAALGVWLCVHGKRVLDEAQASSRWPAVPGKVTACNLTTSHGRNGTTYAAHVAYAYTVGGRELTGSTVWFGDEDTRDRDEAQKTLAQFPVGKEVRVFYRPEQPETAVLEPGTYPSSYQMLVLGVVLGLAGVGVTIAGAVKARGPTQR
jgi:hypothetical protein